MNKALLLSVGLLALAACVRQSGEPEQSTPLSAHEMRERLIEQNRAVLEAERGDIQAFMDSSGLTFESTGTGMYVWTLGSSHGPAIDTAQRVQLRVHVHGLHGEVFSYGLRQEVAVLRDNDAIWGLQEALIRAHVGDSLICIVPAHLAHGLAGDLADIPPLTPLVYYLHILQ